MLRFRTTWYQAMIAVVLFLNTSGSMWEEWELCRECVASCYSCHSVIILSSHFLGSCPSMKEIFQVNLVMPWKLLCCFGNKMLLLEALPLKDSFSEIGFIRSYTRTWISIIFCKEPNHYIKQVYYALIFCMLVRYVSSLLKYKRQLSPG